MKLNSISHDFPFSIKNERRERSPPPQKPPTKFLYHLRNSFNNESPDFLRLDVLKENPKGYKNPYLDDVIAIDRNNYFKELNITRDHINLINKIKSNRELSQDMKNLKLVKGKLDRDIMKKRMNIKNNPEVFDNKTFRTESSEFMNYKLKQFHYGHSPNYYFSFNNVYKSNDDLNNKKLLLNIDPKSSSYLKNFNTFNIRDNENNSNISNNLKNKLLLKNSIIDSDRTEPVNYTSEKWSKFHENYLLLLDTNKGFLNKGGLFTEFANKNKGTFDMKKSLKESDSVLSTNRYTHSTTSPRDKSINKKNSLLSQARSIVEKKNLHKVREMLKNK